MTHAGCKVRFIRAAVPDLPRPFFHEDVPGFTRTAELVLDFGKSVACAERDRYGDDQRLAPVQQEVVAHLLMRRISGFERDDNGRLPFRRHYRVFTDSRADFV
jgi:hypothetical protein